MKQIKSGELFRSVRAFLKSKGIEVQDGSYAHGIRQGCEVLTNSINVSQRTLQRAKAAVGTGLNRIRETIHEKSAPGAAKSGPVRKAASPKPKKSSAKRKTRKTV